MDNRLLNEEIKSKFCNNVKEFINNENEYHNEENHLEECTCTNQ